jgi:septal ring factor EnvC (AmiA/AmiB activator)
MPDDPTRRLPAARPVATERDVAYISDEAVWREHVHDRLRSVTVAVTLVAIVAMAALGVALWALDADERGGVSTNRVLRLERRVEQLDARLRQRPAADDVAAVRERQQSLQERLQTLEDQANAPDQETQAMIEAIESTQQAVAQLEQRVADLEQTAP